MATSLEAADSATNRLARVQVVQGTVEARPAVNANWRKSSVGDGLQAGTQVRTRAQSRATIQLLDNSMLNLGQYSDAVIAAPKKSPPAIARLRVLRGLFFFQDRNRRRELEIDTPTASAVVEGTEFQIAVDDAGATTITMIDGSVTLTNTLGAVTVGNGEQAIAEPNQAPRRTAKVETMNVIQWVLYYPAVLDPAELGLADSAALKASLTAYQAGDLLAALAAIPEGYEGVNEREKVYLRGLHLAIGIPVDTQDATAGGETANLRLALQWLQLAVRGDSGPLPEAQSASQWLARSYFHQAQHDIMSARDAAARAIELSPQFGFAWARLAEAEFSRGRNDAARDAIKRALELSPRHAEAWSVRGFLHLAQEQIENARKSFQQALEIDPMLGNGWLGLGLCDVRQGKVATGVAHFQTATAVEPTRWMFRSYLAKAYLEAARKTRGGPTAHRLRELAAEELAVTKRQDPADPTPYLYQAIADRAENRINDAVRELEDSKRLNDNRSVYRSRVLLDQDRSMRSANLAGIYRDAGLFDAGLQEASRAVEDDYLNHSSHLFLANAYSDLRAASGINLRFESAAVTEYLLYNLLMPVGGGSLSRNVSNQEYSKLFADRGFGLINSTEYFSNGTWQQSGSIYGNWSDFSFALDAGYLSDRGFRINNDLEQTSLSAQTKFRLSERDTFYLQLAYADVEAGDTVQYYDPAMANPVIRVNERQEPLVFAGLDHAWSENLHSLIFAGRLTDNLQVRNPADIVQLGLAGAGGTFAPLATITDNLTYVSDQEIYTAETQQILKTGPATWVLGGLYQTGEIDTRARQDTPSGFPFLFPGGVITDQTQDADMQRASAYLYNYLNLGDRAVLTLGSTYDHLRYPRNFRAVPMDATDDTHNRLSPKLGLTVKPDDQTQLRLAYSRSLAGVSFDQSFRLEPTQIAGFNQAFRSVIPESVAGTASGARLETLAAGINRRFGKRTHVGVELQQLEADQNRDFAAYDVNLGAMTATSFALRQTQDYRERNINAYANHLLGDHWSLGTRYRLTSSRLNQRTRQIAGSSLSQRGTLHELTLQSLYNHPTGFFGVLEGTWYQQSLNGLPAGQTGDDFIQLNARLGYRFAQRRLEISGAILNLTDQDYRLSPINFYRPLPRERLFSLSLRANF